LVGADNGVRVAAELSKIKNEMSPKHFSAKHCDIFWGAFDSAKNHKRQSRKRQSVTAKREKSQTPKFV